MLIFQPQDSIWRPDLRLVNSFKHSKGLGDKDLWVEVLYFGYVSWAPYEVSLHILTRHRHH